MPRSVSTSDWEYELGSTATSTPSSSCRTQVVAGPERSVTYAGWFRAASELSSKDVNIYENNFFDYHYLNGLTGPDINVVGSPSFTNAVHLAAA
eukprot:3717494-Heterocapsa_arctica.AAC.1